MTDQAGSVLRPELYARLMSRYRGKVKISKRGEAIAWHLRPGERGRAERCFDDAAGDDWGEYYRVCCHLCGDTKFRLSINHRWGLFDPETGSRNLWLIKCHHRDCFAIGDQQWGFHTELFSDVSAGVRAADTLVQGHRKTAASGEAVWPGTVWAINRMPEDHPARAYLRDERGFDADWLWETFRIGCLVDPKPRWHYLRGEIVIPVFADSKLVGWQTRIPRAAKMLEGGKKERKYYTMDNMPRSRLLYNFDLARTSDFAVVVEGPTDVWRFGPEAVAVLGTFSGHQAHLLLTHWKKVVVLLDEDAVEVSRALFDILKRSLPTAEVRLPPGMDPGDFKTTAELRGYVAGELARQNFDLRCAGADHR